jgi:group I intron endonuclease
MGFVYLIRNTVNGKCYVGQTMKNKVQKRWHSYTSPKGGHGVIGRAIKKHGKDKFEFSVICELPNEELNDREVREIAERGTLVPNGYNLQAGGDNGPQHEETKRKISLANTGKPGKIPGPETRAKISAASKGRKRTEEQKQKMKELNSAAKKVDQYTLEGVFIRTWDSMTATGAKRVSECCRGKSKTSGGFLWAYHGQPVRIPEPPPKKTPEEIAAAKAKKSVQNKEWRERQELSDWFRKTEEQKVRKNAMSRARLARRKEAGISEWSLKTPEQKARKAETDRLRRARLRAESLS